VSRCLVAHSGPYLHAPQVSNVNRYFAGDFIDVLMLLFSCQIVVSSNRWWCKRWRGTSVDYWALDLVLTNKSKTATNQNGQNKTARSKVRWNSYGTVKKVPVFFGYGTVMTVPLFCGYAILGYPGNVDLKLVSVMLTNPNPNPNPKNCIE